MAMKRLTLPLGVKRPILACGADLKGAFAFAKGRDAYLFDGFGDLSELDNLTRYTKAVKAAQAKLKIEPQIVACDLHPGYFSTQFAEKNGDRHLFSASTADRKKVAVPIFKVQHHEAHIASAMADNHITGKVLGVAFDGTGYGLDGNIWGGEFFAGTAKSFKRIAHLDYIPMPGGEACVREPWRMAASYLYSIFGADFLKLKIDFVKGIDKNDWAVLRGMIDKRINSPLTSSMGRLFDTAGSMILNKREAKFEAQLPIELERIAAKNIDDSYGSSGATIIRGIVRDIEKRVDVSIISSKFHNSIARMILSVANKAKIKKVVLSGGVFQNSYLKDRAMKLLSENDFKVYAHSNVETNDSGIPLGQIAIANVRALCV
jgi:hydrogenase maturation protein HypF